MNKPMFFTPNKTLSAQLNLDSFINLCKNKLTIFGKDLTFESNTWDITEFNNEKVDKHTRIVFSNFKEAREQNKRIKTSPINYLQEPFLTFSKAYIRYRQGLKPVKNLNPIIASLRLVECALIELKEYADPTDVSADILTRAAQIAIEHYSHAYCYRIGQQLEELGAFLTEKRILKIPTDWKNSINRPSDSQRVGKKADENRNKKMPSERALEVMPKIFYYAKEPSDIILISIIALLLGAPNRINEVLTLTYNCEIIQQDSNKDERYGLRWYPSKGAEPMIKWIIPSMVDVIKFAINRIRELTKFTREIALWYENNAHSLFLPKNLEYLRKKEYITSSEISMIIFGKILPHSIIYWLKIRNIPYLIIYKKDTKYKVHPKKITTVRFKDLEKAMLKLLPMNFPFLNKELGIKYSQTLLIKRVNEYHSTRATLIPTVSHFTTKNINDALGARSSVKSLFEKYGFREKNGSSIKVTTHQFRHYLNTLAQKGGISQLDIAKWSGRKDIKQNEDYDHVSANEMLTIMRDAIGDDKALIGHLSNIDDIKKKVVISRDEYARLKVRTAHRTDFGICIHDFLMTPCQLHMDCINCTEQICIKGDKASNANIKERKKDIQRLLKIATKEKKDGNVGANRWVQHHSIELAKLTQLCDILDDPKVPLGSPIQISNVSSSPQITQTEEKYLNNINTSEKDLDINEMWNLLGDKGDDS